MEIQYLTKLLNSGSFNSKDLNEVVYNGSVIWKSEIVVNYVSAISLRRIVADYSGNVITVWNGVSNMTFNFIVDDLDWTAISAHLTAGDGTNRVVEIFNQISTVSSLTFDIADAPSIIQLGDGSLAFDSSNGSKSNNGFTIGVGNTVGGTDWNMVMYMTGASQITVSHFGNTARYLGVIRDGNAGGTVAYSGSPTTLINNVDVPATQDSLHDNLRGTTMKVVSWKDMLFYNDVPYAIGGYGGAVAGSLWALKCVWKEFTIADIPVTEVAEKTQFRQESMDRHNIV